MRESIVKILNTKGHMSSPELMARLVQMYIHHRKQVVWQPTAVDMFQLIWAFEYARDWFCRELEIDVLVDNKGNILMYR